MTLAPHPSLFDPDAQVQTPDSLEDRAAAWIDGNPEAVAVFARIALDNYRRGLRIGAKLIAEQVRWHPDLVETHGGQVRWNNSYTSFVARHVMESTPELDGYFSLRGRS